MNGLSTTVSGALSNVGGSIGGMFDVGGGLQNIVMYFVIIFMDVIKRLVAIMTSFGYSIEASYLGADKAIGWLNPMYSFVSKHL